MAQFTLSFAIGPGNEERKKAFELYRQAFDVTQFSTSTPPGSGDLHIFMKVCGIYILIGPGTPKASGFDSPVNCEIRFQDRTQFDNAYNILRQDCRECSLEGPYPWAEQLALITDMFGIPWALYYNQ